MICGGDDDEVVGYEFERTDKVSVQVEIRNLDVMHLLGRRVANASNDGASRDHLNFAGGSPRFDGARRRSTWSAPLWIFHYISETTPLSKVGVLDSRPISHNNHSSIHDPTLSPRLAKSCFGPRPTPACDPAPFCLKSI